VLQKTLIGVVILLFGLVAVFFFLGRGRLEENLEAPVQPPPLDDRARLETIDLFFGAPDEIGLVREKRSLVAGGTLEDRLRSCVEELASGSLEGHLRVIPRTTRLQRAYLNPWGVAYLDFNRSLLGDTPGDGEEWLAVAALVHTVCATYPEIREVRFLLDGHMIVSLGGYIDLEDPLRAEDFPLSPRGAHGI